MNALAELSGWLGESTRVYKALRLIDCGHGYGPWLRNFWGAHVPGGTITYRSATMCQQATGGFTFNLTLEATGNGEMITLVEPNTLSSQYACKLLAARLLARYPYLLAHLCRRCRCPSPVHYRDTGADHIIADVSTVYHTSTASTHAVWYGAGFTISGTSIVKGST